MANPQLIQTSQFPQNGFQQNTQFLQNPQLQNQQLQNPYFNQTPQLHYPQMIVQHRLAGVQQGLRPVLVPVMNVTPQQVSVYD